MTEQEARPPCPDCGAATFWVKIGCCCGEHGEVFLACTQCDWGWG